MYKLTIEEYHTGWAWELQKGKKIIVISNYAYSTKSNARRGFHRLFSVDTIQKIVEE